MKKSILLILSFVLSVNLFTFAFCFKSEAESQKEYSIFGDITGEDIHNDIDATLSIGVRFSVKVPGKITKVRLYTVKEESGVYPVTFWDAASSKELASFDWTISSGTEGWQEKELPEPVSVEPGYDYVMVVRNNESRHYSFIPCYYRDHDFGDSLFVVHDLSGVFSTDETAIPGNINSNSYPAFLRDVVFVPDYLPVSPRQDEALANENTLYLSDLKIGTSYSYGTTLSVNMANELEEMYIGENKYEHGFALRASPEMNKSYVEINVEGLGMKTFAAYVGVADAMMPDTNLASMSFTVFADGVEKAHSKILTHDDGPELLTADITGAGVIRLTVSPSEYNSGYDADLGLFADAVISKFENAEEIYKSVTVPATPVPTEAPTAAPTDKPEEKTTDAPADAAEKPAENKAEETGKGTSAGVVIGIAAGVIAVTAVIIVIIVRKVKK